MGAEPAGVKGEVRIAYGFPVSLTWEGIGDMEPHPRVVRSGDTLTFLPPRRSIPGAASGWPPYYEDALVPYGTGTDVTGVEWGVQWVPAVSPLPTDSDDEPLVAGDLGEWLTPTRLRLVTPGTAARVMAHRVGLNPQTLPNIPGVSDPRVIVDQAYDASGLPAEITVVDSGYTDYLGLPPFSATMTEDAPALMVMVECDAGPEGAHGELVLTGAFDIANEHNRSTHPDYVEADHPWSHYGSAWGPYTVELWMGGATPPPPDPGESTGWRVGVTAGSPTGWTCAQH